MSQTENSPGLPDNTVYDSIRTVLANARQKAYTAVNFAMVEAYWEIGRQIMEAQKEQRAEYGAGLIRYLAGRLTAEFGKGFTVTNLKYMRQFYSAFPIGHTLCDQLSWSHYRLLAKIEEPPRREFYVKECAECNWSVRQLERQITQRPPLCLEIRTLSSVGGRTEKGTGARAVPDRKQDAGR